LKIEELRGMSEEELMRHHDEQTQYRAHHYNIYLDELARREMVEQGKRMEALTKSINHLTWVIMGATIVGAFLTAVSLLSSS
jgi:hypothetical protein